MAQQTLNADETVLAEASDGTRLVVLRDLATEWDDERETRVIRKSLQEIDHEPGAVKFPVHDPDVEVETNDMELEKFREARLAYGLWLKCGPFNQPEGGAVPREIATDGMDAVTAYIHLNNGFPLAREATADICGVAKQTVSDRLS